MKKTVFKLGMAIVISIIVISLFITAIIMVPIKINDYNLGKYKEEVLANINLPEKTELVEYVAGCGNSTGGGDHTDLYVAVLLKSELSWEELSKTFGRVQIINGEDNKTIPMYNMNLEFKTKTDGEGYYIAEFRKPGILDWRGC